MEYSNLTPRTEPAALNSSLAAKQAPGTMSTRAETARPVLAAEVAGQSSATKGDGFQPLDTFVVGDNDYVPVPPEPPRQATVLAVIADAIDEAEAAKASDAEEASAPDTPPAPTDPLSDALRTIEAGPDNPTVDIRR